ncbi:MAG TPA: CHRD domain-containing protein [Rhodoferax sp.]
MFSQFNAKCKRFVSGALLTLAGCANIAYADVVALTGTLSAAPNATSGGMGTIEATLNTQTNQLKWKVDYSGLSGSAGAAHFHGPAEPGQNAGVVLGFKGNVESPITGDATITPAQANDLLSGKWYVNIHTKAYPGGEIRAQVMPAK